MMAARLACLVASRRPDATGVVSTPPKVDGCVSLTGAGDSFPCMSRTPLAALAALLILAAPASAADFSGTALNIIPSGQYGGLPVPANADQQAKMYDALTPLGDQVTSG